MSTETKQALVAGLAASHGEQLRRFLVTRVRNASDIPDIMQEIFLRLLRVPDHEAIRSPEAYLFTVARHVAQQHTLQSSPTSRSVELQQMLTELAAVPNDPALEVSAEQSLQELERAFDELAPMPRAAFLLHRREGMTLEEIAKRLGVARPTAKKYLAKALVQFRKKLEGIE